MEYYLISRDIYDLNRHYWYIAFVFLDVSSMNTDIPKVDLIFRNDILALNSMSCYYMANRNPVFTFWISIRHVALKTIPYLFIAMRAKGAKVQYLHTLIVNESILFSLTYIHKVTEKSIIIYNILSFVHAWKITGNIHWILRLH